MLPEVAPRPQLDRREGFQAQPRRGDGELGEGGRRMAVARRPEPVAERQTELLRPDRQRRDRAVEQHEIRAGWGARRHGLFGAALAAQEAGQPVAARPDQLGVGELQYLPGAACRLHRGAIAARQYVDVRQSGQGSAE